MREKSQLEEMRAAIRGDLERSRARFEPPQAPKAPEPPQAPPQAAAEVVDSVSPAYAEEAHPEPEPAVEQRKPGLFASFIRRR